MHLFEFQIRFHSLSDISSSAEADFIVSFSHFLFAFGSKSVTFDLVTVGPTDLVRALIRSTQGSKMKELNIFSQLNEAWKLDQLQVGRSFSHFF